ncbi:DNA-binding protein [Armillaria mellea]|nr:DNA-binding protein [Armillaria mellea]
MTANFPLTFNQTVQGIADFIEVAIHTILYVRQIYPADLFIRRKRYDTPVFQSRHPALNEYISGAVKAVIDELSRGNVDKVVVVIKNKEQQPLERFIFAVENMVQVEGFNKDTRQTNLQITFQFAIVIELKDNNVPSAITNGEPPSWMPAEIQHTTYGASKSAELSLIRAVNTGVINVIHLPQLSLAVQESEEKLNKEKELSK